MCDSLCSWRVLVLNFCQRVKPQELFIPYKYNDTNCIATYCMEVRALRLQRFKAAKISAYSFFGTLFLIIECGFKGCIMTGFKEKLIQIAHWKLQDNRFLRFSNQYNQPRIASTWMKLTQKADQLTVFESFPL